MKCLKVSVLVALLISVVLNVQGQDKFGMKFKIHHSEDSGLAYNFFVGEDAVDFQTMIMSILFLAMGKAN